MKRLVSVALTVVLLLTSFPVFSKTVETIKSNQTEFRAFFYDIFDDNSFLYKDNESYKDVIKYAKNNCFRAVFFKTTTSGSSIYPSRFLNNLAKDDLLDDIITYAHKNGVKVYAVIDVQNLTNGSVSSRLNGWTVNGEWNLSVPQVRDFILSYTKELAEYNLDGIVADNFWYSSKDFADEKALELYSQGTKESHRLNATETLLTSMYKAVKKISPSTYFGVGTPSVCVNKENDKNGSKTYGDESVNDNFFDIRQIVKQGCADFISPHMTNAIADDDYSYLNIVEWYSDLINKTDISLIPFVMTSFVNEKLLFDKYEIVNQIQLNRNVDSLGHILSDYHSLKTTDVMEVLAPLYQLSGVFNMSTDLTFKAPLEVTLPESYKTTVYYSSYYIAGTCNPLLKLYLNGKEVTSVGKAGVFGVLVNLNKGDNYFTFTQGEESVSINIVRKVSSTGESVITKNTAMFPTYDDFVYSGEEITLSCTAPSGAVVTAQVGRETFTLEQEKEATKGYPVKHSLKVVLNPSVSESETTNIGKITYTLYNGDNVEGFTSVGSVFYVGKNSRAAVVCIEELGLGTLYKKPDTNSDVSAYIYTGVKEYVIGSSGNFFILQSGGYIPKGSVDPVSGKIDLKNNISGGILKVYEDYEKIVLDTSKNSAFTAKLTDNSLTVTLYNTGATPSIDLSNSRVLSGMSAEKKDNCTVYTFTQKKSNALWGYHIDYLGEKTVITLKYPPKISNDPDKPLKDVTVVIDPGHGREDPGALGPAGNSGACEKDLNMAVSAQLKLQLEKLGAKVYVTRTTDIRVDYEGRLGFSDAVKPDFFISVHHNSTAITNDSSKSSGFEIYYHWSRSKTFAQNLHDKVIEITGKKSRDIHYADYRVTRMYYAPSVLVECGYMLNPNEYSTLITSEEIKNTAKGLAQGVLKTVKQNG